MYLEGDCSKLYSQEEGGILPCASKIVREREYL